jgi:antimicrobial peptide system protein, SdpA family
MKLRLFITLISTTVVIFSLFFAGLINAMPHNPLENMKSKTLLKIFPQGWGFFSKSPRDSTVTILNESLESAANWPNNSLKNLFGINRFGRTQGIEMGLIFSQVPNSSWKVCEEDLRGCINQNDEVVTVNNTTPKPSFCGSFILVSREPIPWAWSKIATKDSMPSKYVRVEAICSSN